MNQAKCSTIAVHGSAIAAQHGLTTAALQSFVDDILDRMILDGEHLSDPMASLDLGWKARTKAKFALMADLHPLLTQRTGGRNISGLSANNLGMTHTKTRTREGMWKSYPRLWWIAATNCMSRLGRGC